MSSDEHDEAPSQSPLVPVHGAPWIGLDERAQLVFLRRNDWVRGSVIDTEFRHARRLHTDGEFTAVWQGALRSVGQVVPSDGREPNYAEMQIVAVHPVVFIVYWDRPGSGSRAPVTGSAAIGGMLPG